MTAWSGLCLQNKHGLDYQGQPCDLCLAEAGWVRIVPNAPPVCDLCHRQAIWTHPAGGFRCKRCPRPESAVMCHPFNAPGLPRTRYGRGADGLARPIEPWPNTESVRARQAAGQPVSFLESIQARPRELDAPQDTTLTLPDGTVLDRAAIDELLIGMGYRKKPTTTRKRPTATRKKAGLPISHRKKARKRA